MRYLITGAIATIAIILTGCSTDTPRMQKSLDTQTITELNALLAREPFVNARQQSSYKEFAEWYYELNLPITAIESIYQHAPLTESLVRLLNPEVGITQAQEAAEEIGYPSGQSNA